MIAINQEQPYLTLQYSSTPAPVSETCDILGSSLWSFAWNAFPHSIGQLQLAVQFIVQKVCPLAGLQQAGWVPDQHFIKLAKLYRLGEKDHVFLEDAPPMSSTAQAWRCSSYILEACMGREGYDTGTG